MDKYKVMVGLELHCEISKTKSKVFSQARNGYNEEPNANVVPVDLGLPGTLPVVNKKACEFALMASMCFNCKLPEYIYFERKNYYYPDLPKGFQTTQETKPAPVGSYGYVEFKFNDEIKKVRINNLHLEEDAASMVHAGSSSYINYSRAGVPLLELVTEPDIESADEAVAFLETVRSIYQFAGISDADSKLGQIKSDVNVSIMDKNLDSTNPANWGTKIEIKNVNSIGGIRDAINYEIKRQIELKEDNKYDEMKQQTRRWDEDKQETIFMREKVDAIDYKYFIEPNIPKYKVTKEWLDEIRSKIPMLPKERIDKYMHEYNLSEYDSTILVKEKNISDYFEDTIKLGLDPKISANWIISVILGYLNKYDLDISEIYVNANMFTEILKLMVNNEISSKQAKDVLLIALDEKKDPKTIIEEKGMKQNSDQDFILSVINEVLSEHLDLINDYKNGKVNVVDFLVGQVMKKTRGQANPTITRSSLISEIEKR